MPSTAVRRLSEVRLADAGEVGSKAASLGELLAAHVHVPDGAVMAADTADMALKERDELLRAAADDLGAGPFAVRSSGIAEDGVEHSYAGIYETVLDVPADKVAAAVDRCLASVRSARVEEYQPGTTGRMAVIIQRMIQPAAAGVALTADPISGDRHACVVTAVRGTGDRLVSGEAIGDEWIVRDDRITARRRPEGAINRRQVGAVAREARADRDVPRRPAGHRVGDR